jgi:hypothetical protein
MPPRRSQAHTGLSTVLVRTRAGWRVQAPSPTAPRTPTQPTQPTHPTRLTQPTQPMQPTHPRFPTPPTTAALPRIPMLSATTALNATAALPTVPALAHHSGAGDGAGAADDSGARERRGAADHTGPLTVPALPTTPELSAGPTVPSAICDASLLVRSAFLAVRGDLPRGEVSAHGVHPALPGCRFTARARDGQLLPLLRLFDLGSTAPVTAARRACGTQATASLKGPCSAPVASTGPLGGPHVDWTSQGRSAALAAATEMKSRKRTRTLPFRRRVT